MTKRDAKQRLRKDIFDEWNRICAYCGCIADTLDHVRPRVRGGLTVRENLIPACSDCNLRKGHSDAIEWFRSQSAWSEEREARIRDWTA